ncbi:hypothetical protein DI005_09910 [Prauserella sp. PE36]|uniref:J domain-containing protein n=1 Tax=Prauserella endophytica TaxID=1592324 RepID=A0ABY2SBL6_9PSEU|nr:hypothetical protein DI005_09910 [Prauserella sp. PE36]TKG73022.1 hypothetical protein FCN18_06775 [Prauserella endophytica]
MRRRAEFRAFVRRHHPDVGGDPDVFVAGVARFRQSESETGGESESSRDPGRDRSDAPVVFTTRRGGITGVLARWRRRRRHRRVR